jgi:hypothetical protein
MTDAIKEMAEKSAGIFRKSAEETGSESLVDLEAIVRDVARRDYGASLDDDTLWDIMCSVRNAAV